MKAATLPSPWTRNVMLVLESGDVRVDLGGRSILSMVPYGFPMKPEVKKEIRGVLLILVCFISLFISLLWQEACNFGSWGDHTWWRLKRFQTCHARVSAWTRDFYCGSIRKCLEGGQRFEHASLYHKVPKFVFCNHLNQLVIWCVICSIGERRFWIAFEELP